MPTAPSWVASRADSCSEVRLKHGEPLHATAPVRGASWLLVEHPGPWPSAGLPRDLPPDVVRIWEAAAAAGIGCQWIRRVRDRRRSSMSVFVVGTQPGQGWAEHRLLRDPRELLDLDLLAMAQGHAPRFGAVTEQRIVLVCTHGNRDVCCARYGRSAALGLDRRLPGQVWETTHIGGHRFAANVVALPDGSCHGGVLADDVDHLAAAIAGGRVVPARLRGRVGLPAEVQAADYYARIRCGVLRVDAIVPIGYETVGPGGIVRVDLEIDGRGRYAVHLSPRRIVTAGPASCDEPGTGERTTFDLVRMNRSDWSRVE